MRKRKVLVGLLIAIQSIATCLTILLLIPPPADQVIPSWIAQAKVLSTNSFEMANSGGSGPFDSIATTETRILPMMDYVEFAKKLKVELNQQGAWRAVTNEPNNTSWYRKTKSDNHYFWASGQGENVLVYHQCIHHFSWLESMQRRLCSFFHAKS